MTTLNDALQAREEVGYDEPDDEDTELDIFVEAAEACAEMALDLAKASANLTTTARGEIAGKIHNLAHASYNFMKCTAIDEEI